jgi:CDP-diacylglycerol pyrophosphatase
MAINSSIHRGQDQLHIHIDCIQSDVLTQIGRRADEVPQEWSELPFDLGGCGYMAIRVNSADLEGVNPFQLLAQGIEAARMDMPRETLVVIGARFADHYEASSYPLTEQIPRPATLPMARTCLITLAPSQTLFVILSTLAQPLS